MKTVLFCIPLKKGCADQYKEFAQESVRRADEYKEMMTRYDIFCAKIWHKKIGDNDYVFVYHEAGPSFEDKMKGWDTSDHSFDTWFREGMMATYDIENAAGMETPDQVIDFTPFA